GPTTTSLAKKKSRLIFATLSQAPQTSNFPKRWELDNSPYTVVNHANVFSRDNLDIGARLFIDNLPQTNQPLAVVDLGCGNGVIGLSLLAKSPNCRVTFVDESYMAVASARQTIEDNMPEQLNQCRFVVDDCLTSQDPDSTDIVLCNPPFHQQQAVTDHIAWQMFKDAQRVLKPGGKLVIVGNRNLAYHIKLKRLFSNYQTLDSNKKFTILSATKNP
ncbi:MAG: 23S rRNA (guanine1835-N2)-methyltransferase, partial [Alteromonadaceae bacterium]